MSPHVKELILYGFVNPQQGLGRLVFSLLLLSPSSSFQVVWSLFLYLNCFLPLYLLFVNFASKLKCKLWKCNGFQSIAFQDSKMLLLHFQNQVKIIVIYWSLGLHWLYCIFHWVYVDLFNWLHTTENSLWIRQFLNNSM